MTTIMKLKIESDTYGVKGIKGYSFNGKIIDFIPFQKNVETVCFLNGNSITSEERKNAYLEIIEKINLGEIIIDDADLILEEAKKEKIQEAKDLYTQHQVVKLLDSITIYLPLRGDFYDRLRERVNTAKNQGFCSISIIDINGDVFQARDDLSCKRVPYIFINEFIFCNVNTASETNKLRKDDLIGNSDYNSQGLIQKATSPEALNAININIFTPSSDIDLDLMINDFYSKSDAEIKALDYSQYDIDNFRNWKDELSADVNGKYIIFQKR